MSEVILPKLLLYQKPVVENMNQLYSETPELDVGM